MLKEINSQENRIFKNTKKLLQKKYRDREGLCLIEGPNLVREILREDFGVRWIIIRESDSEQSKVDQSLLRDLGMDLEALDKLSKTIGVYMLPKRLFSQLSDTIRGQGILAVVNKPLWDPGDFILRNKSRSNLLILDRLQDPGNIGTLIRVCEGAGYGGVIAIKGTGDIFSPKTIRSGAGSVFRVPIIHAENNREIQTLCTMMGKRIVVTAMDGTEDYFNADLKERIALVIGNEGNGVDSELMDMADLKIRIPMGGKLESLNAGIAGGIIMYESVRP